MRRRCLGPREAPQGPICMLSQLPCPGLACQQLPYLWALQSRAQPHQQVGGKECLEAWVVGGAVVSLPES